MKFATQATTLSALAVTATLAIIPAASCYADASQDKWQQLFEQLDQDKDGLLSRSEYERAKSMQATTQNASQVSHSSQPSQSAQSQYPSLSQIASQQSQQAQSHIPSQQAQSQGSPQQALTGNPYLQHPYGGSPSYGIPQSYGMPQAYGAQPAYGAQQVYRWPPAGYPQMPYMYPQMAQGQAPWVSGSSQRSGQIGFDMFDLDRNGYLTSQEALRYFPLMQHWSRADANRDGVIERSEFSAFESSQGR